LLVTILCANTEFKCHFVSYGISAYSCDADVNVSPVCARDLCLNTYLNVYDIIFCEFRPSTLPLNCRTVSCVRCTQDMVRLLWLHYCYVTANNRARFLMFGGEILPLYLHSFGMPIL
jgi:hypothetical protein